MKSKLKQSLFIIFASLLAVFFVGLTVKQIDLKSMKETLSHTNFFWVFFSMALSIVTYWIRASRWSLLLKPMGYPTKLSSNFWAIAFAYFMNLTIPRSGEVARATTLYKMEGVPFEKGFGSIVLERVIDLLCLILLLGLTVILNYEIFLKFLELGQLENANSTTVQTKSYTVYYIVLALMGIALLSTIIFRKKIVQLNLYAKIKTFLSGLWEGILSISKLEKRGQFIGYSVALWICYFSMTYMVFFAFPDTHQFTPADALFLLVAGSLGMILPVSGGLAYPYAISIAFAAITLTKMGNAETGRTIGNYFGLILYLAQIISMITFGLISIFFISRNKKKINQS